MSFHGPFVSHLSYNTTTAPNCPPGTIWTFEGVCVCIADSGCTPTTDTVRSCHQVNYAVVPGACDNSNQANFVFTPNQCEPRYAFSPSCTVCQCSQLAPALTPADSYTSYQQLADTTTQSNLETIMDNAAFPAGATHLYTGLQYVNNTMFRLGSGMREPNASIPRILVIITSRRSNPGFEPAELPTTLQDKVREMQPYNEWCCLLPELGISHPVQLFAYMHVGYHYVFRGRGVVLQA